MYVSTLYMYCMHCSTCSHSLPHTCGTTPDSRCGWTALAYYMYIKGVVKRGGVIYRYTDGLASSNGTPLLNYQHREWLWSYRTSLVWMLESVYTAQDYKYNVHTHVHWSRNTVHVHVCTTSVHINGFTHTYTQVLSLPLSLSSLSLSPSFPPPLFVSLLLSLSLPPSLSLSLSLSLSPSFSLPFSLSLTLSTTNPSVGNWQGP